MKVIKVSVSYGLTINLGDYNNIKPEVSYEAQLDKGESEQDVIAALFEQGKRDIADLLKDQCMHSLALLNFRDCHSYADVEAFCLKRSSLYRYIHNLNRKLAVEDMAYPLWMKEEARRKQDHLARQMANNIRHATPTTVALHKTLSDHDPIADIDDDQYADDRDADSAGMTQD